jgi:hypothetical protein
MRLNFPKVERPILLSDYAPEFGEQEIKVWVNPPVARMTEFIEVLQNEQTKDDEVFERLAYFWVDWTAEEIKEIYTHCRENEPGLWSYLVNRTLEVALEYRSAVKKV